MSSKTTTKPMTLKQAAKIWKRCKAEQEKLNPKIAAARDVLLAHFEATNTTKAEGIQLAVDTRSQLDTARVRAFLGDKIAEFTKMVPSRTLSLCEEP